MKSPQRAQVRHELIVKLISQAFGNDVFDGTVLEGRRIPEKLRVTSYLALYYSNGVTETAFLRLSGDDPLDGTSAAKQVQHHDLTPGDARGLFVHTLFTHSFEASMFIEESLDQAVLNAAEEYIKDTQSKLGVTAELPVAFVCFCSAISDGTRKIVFFYPKGTAPDRLLRVFKDKMIRAYQQ